jgi:hypothetical protein
MSDRWPFGPPFSFLPMSRGLLHSLVAAVASLLLVASPGAAQTGVPAPNATLVAPDAPHQSGANVTISLLTMGNGENVWELFGHSAIWVHDNVTSRDTVFNWGVFDFRQPHFLQRYLRGKRLYSMGGDSMERVLLEYRDWNRTVLAQELDLTTEQKETILAAIRTNARPENVNYLYDDFRDNCSTRIRDIFDRALGGRLFSDASHRKGTTYRWHTLRLMQGSFWTMLGVDIALGLPADRPISVWDEMFLPRQLHDYIAGAHLDSPTGARPLVKSERVLFQSTRGPEPERPPKLGVKLGMAGCAFAILLLCLAAASTKDTPWIRGITATLLGLWALVAGLLGVVLTLLWSVTNHVIAHGNENLLLFNPLWLVLVVLLPMFVWSRKAVRATRLVCAAAVTMSVMALVAHLVGVSGQVNLPIIALALPPALAVAAIVARD